MLSRLVWGARVSLLAGVGIAGLAMLVGVALAIFAVVVAIHLVGDTVRDLLDPRVRAT